LWGHIDPELADNVVVHLVHFLVRDKTLRNERCDGIGVHVFACGDEKLKSMSPPISITSIVICEWERVPTGLPNRLQVSQALHTIALLAIINTVSRTC